MPVSRHEPNSLETVAMLPNEEEEHDELETLLRRSFGASEPTDRFIDQLNERLLGELAGSRQFRVQRSSAAFRTSETARLRNRITSWIGGSTMRQRIALGGIGLVAAVAILLIWTVSSTTPVSAMEKMAEEVRKAKSFKCTAIGKGTSVLKFGDPPKTVETKRESRTTEYRFAPDSIRMEDINSDTWNGPGPELLKITPGGNNPYIMIDNRQKTFQIRTLSEKQEREIALFSPDKLGRLRGEADRDLGDKEINGKKARGFIVDPKKIDPELSTPGVLEIWLDNETNLPVLIRTEGKSENGSWTTETTDIQWNIDLDSKLFDTTPPEGYRNVTRKTPTSGDPVGHITEALKIYARAGRYPSKSPKINDEDMVEVNLHVLDSLKSELERGKMPWQLKADTDEKKIRAEKLAKEELEHIAKEREGFLHLWAIVTADRDFAYYGATVTPKDTDKVLLRWKLDNGQYEVIFGDLRAETVTASKLQALERR